MSTAPDPSSFRASLAHQPGSSADGPFAPQQEGGLNLTGDASKPCFTGILDTTYDALLLFEASRRGMVPRVKKRIPEEQRDSLIRSGSVFIFEEEESGIKRWTDGLIWSPSRILGNFLVYRQTEQRNSRGNQRSSTSKPAKLKSVQSPETPPSPTAELSPPPKAVKKEPLVRPVPPPGKKSFSSTPSGLDPASLLGLSAPQDSGLQSYFASAQAQVKRRKDDGEDLMAESDDEKDLEELVRIKERSLVGSLTNAYAFKDGGLVKRTISMLVNGRTQHLVSYYTLTDGMSDRFRTPSSLPELADFAIDHQLLAKQHFRFPPVTEIGQDGILRYVSEADNSASPEPESPSLLPKEPKNSSSARAIPVQPHPYFGEHSAHPSSYPYLGAPPPLIETAYASSLQHQPSYALQGIQPHHDMVGYGVPAYSTYSAPSSIPQWSSSLPKEFHHPAALSPHSMSSMAGSPFRLYNPPLPTALPPTNPNRANSFGTGPQRRRRASQTSGSGSGAEGRHSIATSSPLNQANRPLAGGKGGYHPYAMPSPTEGWTAFHPSSKLSPSASVAQKTSYFEVEPSVFAGGPLSGMVSGPSSAGSSLSAGSGSNGGLIPPKPSQTNALAPVPSSALPPSRRISLNFPRDSPKSFNSPRHRRSPSMQPSPLRLAAPLPAYAEEGELHSLQPQRSASASMYSHTLPQPHTTYAVAPLYAIPDPQEVASRGHDATWGQHSDDVQHGNHHSEHSSSYSYYGSSGDPLAHYASPTSPPGVHSISAATSSFYHPSLLLNPPTTSFAEDKQSVHLALDQAHLYDPSSASSNREPSPSARVDGGEYHQVPSGMVAPDDGGSNAAFPMETNDYQPHPGAGYWAE